MVPTINSLDDLEKLVYGFEGSAIFFSALKTGIFEALAVRPLSAPAIAEECQLDPRGVAICCDALVALGVVKKRDATYELPAELNGILSENAPDSRVAMYRYQSEQMLSWFALGDRLQGAEPTHPLESNKPAAVTGSVFGKALESVARESARATAAALNLSAVSKMLDLGGGTGSYMIEFLLAAPHLSVTLFEAPEPVEIAQTHAASAGVSDRAAFIPGDMFKDSLGGPYDFIFLSNIVHMFSPERNIALLRRAAHALEAGGTLCIKDFYLTPERTAPARSALFAVHMLLRGEGNCYTDNELTNWMHTAGFELKEVLPLAAQSQLVLASKV